MKIRETGFLYGLIGRGSGRSTFPNIGAVVELAKAGYMSEEEREQHLHEMKMQSRNFIARKCGKRGRY
ncbi:hypothetical protein COM97_27280 [Bacillus thuringiensis]|uniref:hypothetical protein n=1 Tax=Bacillus thuringiensis TaxID=1428 RepID=UPI000BECE90C|nr:hypothetical protein [Bacillus thuringiensis]PEF03445.1 hypothetical protein COM97_27280 [Bacillus thuringiensis]